MDTTAKRWVFGPAVLDQRRLELQINGLVVKIDKKPLEVLLYLLQHADEMIGKDELQTAVWPRRILSDTVLTKTLSRLRVALNDGDETLIKTVRGYGYRLVVPVRTETTVDCQSADLKSNGITAPAERRQISILYGHWVNAAVLSERVDAEIFSETLLTYHHCAEAIVKRYGGHVAGISGDGIEIHFGYPVAHDDDAERAVRCGYELLQSMSQLAPEPRLAVQAGVHTGTVVIGGDTTGATGGMALGLTCNLAARVAAMAEPGQLLISAATQERVPGLFIVKRQPVRRLQIGRNRLPVYKVVQATGMRSRLEASKALTPFVGRTMELSLLTHLWQRSRIGHGQALLISGDPGLGKSRLLLRLRDSLRDSAHSWLECRAHALSQGTPYRSIIDLLQQVLQFSETDAPGLRLQYLEQGLQMIGEDRKQAIPLLAPLFDLPASAQYPPSQSPPHLKQRQTNELLSRWLLALGRRQALVLAIEDLHWADPMTLQVLTQLLQQLPGSRILVVMTARPEFKPAWQMLHLTSIVLESLSGPQVEEMLKHLIKNRALSPALSGIIQERANGVPLFVEELTKTLFESGLVDKHGTAPESLTEHDLRSIPIRLQDLLAARLDRLDTARECAQIASAIEGEIPHRLLALVAGGDETRLRAQIKRLIDAELLYARGTPPTTCYVFKHALIRDAAYDLLLNKDRKLLHQKIAVALETHFPERADAEPALLAQHFERAENTDKAVSYLERAATAALVRSAPAEAIQHCEHALSLLSGLSGSDANATIQLRLLLLQTLCRLILTSLGGPEVGGILAQAAAILDRVPDPMLQGRTLASLWQHRLVRGELSDALGLATRLQELAATSKIDVLRGLGGIAAGWTRWMLGEPAPAWRDLESALKLLDETTSRQIIGIIGSDGRSDCLTLMASLSWWLGFPQRAQTLIPRALAAAQSSGDFISMSIAAFFAETMVPVLQRRADGLIDACVRFETLAEKNGHQGMIAMARMQRGLALSMQGMHEEGLAMLQQALDEQPEHGSLVIISMYRCLQAQQCLIAGRLDDAARALSLAAAAVDRYQTRLWEAELHRLQGELILARNTDDTSSAEACFQQALAVSRRQKARSLELRAATSLGRLWQTQNRADAARELIAPIYAGFTEGFELPDLLEARCLMK